MLREIEPSQLERRQKLDLQASSAHDLMLALMDVANAQKTAAGLEADRLAECPTCQTCGHNERKCVRGLYVKGLRPDDESELLRLRGQGCHVQVVDAQWLEAVAPDLLGVLRRAVAAE
ncbi:hypothetical protein M2323_003753 [Rhodoblastus acidophilus]|nr:hypothetical protein [Rhodoblastus acidophilus]MCW2285888.1 hypothetical protein [Rhodoblastus acidophilus]MCW2334811.1 hypothetical protein [Rhodoblastus acidophilus]